MDRAEVYVCDLDGTLLRSDGTLSPFAREGLNRLLEAGVSLTVASARGTPGMRSLLTGVAIRLPVIELNGAFVSEIESGRHLISNVLLAGESCAAVEVILATGNDPVITTWDGRRDGVHFGSRTNDSTSWYVEEKRKHRDPRLEPCLDLLGIAREEDVAQITTFVLDQEAPALVERLHGAAGDGAIVHSAANFYWPGWTEITVQHRDAVKGAAIPALLAACGSPDADVVACGDHLNDLSMFAVAAHSIAPANAHPEVLGIATEVVGANDEDGIVRHLLDRHGLPHAPGLAD
ncbi:MAG: HAD hydrolase family protein [Solirubrobacterales bacterium]